MHVSSRLVLSYLPLPGNKTQGTGAAKTAGGDVVKELFRKFDKNRDGHISQEEFSTALTELGLGMTPHEVQSIFQRFDTHGRDDALDLTEFIAFYKHYTDTLDTAYSKPQANSRPLYVALEIVRHKVSQTLREMRLKRVLSLQINHWIFKNIYLYFVFCFLKYVALIADD